MSKKILVIDDDSHDQKLLKILLGKEGYSDVFLADSGEDGVALAEKESPEIVLVDTQLPGMNGFETCRAIKSIEGLDPKVIIVTGAVEAIDAATARESGCDAYCAKTRDCSSLLEAVKRMS